LIIELSNEHPYLESPPQEEQLDAVGGKHSQKLEVGTQVDFLLVPVEIPVVHLDLVPDLQTAHEDAISLLLDGVQLLGCSFLVPGSFLLVGHDGVNVDIDRNVLELFLFLAGCVPPILLLPVVGHSELVELGLYLKLQELHVLHVSSEEEFVSGGVDEVDADGALVVVVRIALVHDSHLHEQVAQLLPSKVDGLAPNPFPLQQDLRTVLGVGFELPELLRFLELRVLGEFLLEC
jgi:hypothetical protein